MTAHDPVTAPSGGGSVTVHSDGTEPPGRPSTTFASPRRSLRGWGRALVIEVPAPWVDNLGMVSEALASLGGPNELDTSAGTGPVAFGALPFDRGASARFIVPAVVVGWSADGSNWITRTPVSAGASGASEDPWTSAAAGSETASPTVASVTVTSPRAAEDWCDAVRRATERIADGELDKVVLARELVVTADAPIDPHLIAERLGRAHPHALRFDIDGFVGASPELLVSRIGDRVRSHPMAGTTPRTGDEEIDSRQAAELLESAKNRGEHQITIDMVLDTLLDFTSFVDAEPAPSVVAAGSVQHLATLVEGQLSAPPASVLELVAALHPTPAVGGSPRKVALDLIGELEATDRGRYAGPVGWVDAAGNGAFAVGLRSASIEGSVARLFAGVGIVEDSDPLAELDETRSKFAATLGAFTRL